MAWEVRHQQPEERQGVPRAALNAGARRESPVDASSPKCRTLGLRSALGPRLRAYPSLPVPPARACASPPKVRLEGGGDKGEQNRQGGGAQQGRRGNQNNGNREPEWRGWESVRMGGSDNKGDGLASQPRRYRVPGQPLQPASGGGCLPQPRWAVCAAGAGAHQGQTSREGEKGHMVDGQDNAWRDRAPGPHAHRNTTRQATDSLWTEARGQQKQSNNPHNNQHILNTPTTGRR